MPVDVQDEPPFLATERYERDCPRPNCEARVVFHYGQVSRGPIADSHTLSVLSKCLNPDCGYKDTYEPVISDTDRTTLREHFGGDLYIPWSDEHVDEPDAHIDAAYSDETAATIREHLEDLGYF